MRQYSSGENFNNLGRINKLLQIDVTSVNE